MIEKEGKIKDKTESKKKQNQKAEIEKWKIMHESQINSKTQSPVDHTGVNRKRTGISFVYVHFLRVSRSQTILNFCCKQTKDQLARFQFYAKCKWLFELLHIWPFPENSFFNFVAGSVDTKFIV